MFLIGGRLVHGRRGCAAQKICGETEMSKKKLTCDKCGGKCCTYVAVELDTPTSTADFEDIIYYMHHRDVKICVVRDDPRSRTWYLQFDARCRYLGPDGRCLIYEHRPKVCREHSLEGCEYHEAESFRDIETVHQLFDFMREIGRGKWVPKLADKLPPSLR